MRRRGFLHGFGSTVFLWACGGRDDVAHSLPTQHIQFVPGMRQDLTDELAPPGSLYSAANVRYSKTGGIFVRPGTSLQSATTQDSSHVITGTTPLSYLGKIGDTALLGKSDGENFALDADGRFNFCGLTSTVLPLRKRYGLVTERSGAVASNRYASASSTSGYVLVASCDGGSNLNVSVQSDDGTQIVSEVSALATATKCAAVAIGDTFILVSQNGATLTGHAIAISASGAVTYTTVAVATLNSASQYWDICDAPSGFWYLLYQNTATNITLERWSTALSINGFNIVAITVTGNCPCSIFYDSTNSRIWAGWIDNFGATNLVKLRAWTTGGVALCAVTTLPTTAGGFGVPLIGMPGSVGSAFFTHNPSSFRCTFGYVTLPANAANVCTSVSYHAWWVNAISKPDARQRSWAVTTATTWTSSTAAESYTSGDTVVSKNMLLKWKLDNAASGSVLVELACREYDWNLSARPADYFSVASSVSGVYTFAAPIDLRVGALRSLEVYQYQDSDAHRWRSKVNMGAGIDVAGQPITMFGRSRGVADLAGTGTPPRLGGSEVGFPMAPQIISVAETANANLTLLGTYDYIAVFEWITNGERHRSAPSAPLKLTLTGANAGVNLTISAPNIGQRWDDSTSSYPVIHIYRTEAGGNVHWRITPGDGAPVARDATDGIISYNDQTSDALALFYGDALYVDQALCDYSLAPSCRFMWRDERRIWFGGLWEADQVACSLDIIPDQPIESSDFAGLNGPVFRVLIGERATGGEYQDGVNYVFARRAIYAFSGDGPDRQGNGDFSRPRVITRETGCKDYRSVRATSRGVFFQSDRGIELIPRGGGNPVFVGAGITDLIATYSECLGTAIHADGKGRSVRFLMQNPSNSQRIVAVYDLDYGAWSLDSFPYDVDVIGEWPNGTALGLADLSGSDCALVALNDSTDAQDGGGAITSTLQTNVIRPWGIVGYGRLNSVNALFSKTNSSDAITLGANVDGVASPGGAWNLDGTDGSEYREITICKECTGFDLTIEFSRGNAARQAVFHGVTVETTQLQGSRRNPASKQ